MSTRFGLALLFAAIVSAAPVAAKESSPSPAVPCEAAPVVKAPRMALIIANGQYSGGWKPLTSPGGDQKLLAKAFARAGFSVAVLCDGTAATMRATLADFGEAAAGADTALVYFAGHGIEQRGRNYLIPIGAQPVATADIDDDFVPVDALITALNGAKVALMLLDACRTEASPGGDEVDSIGSAIAFDGVKGAIGFATARGQPAFDAAPPTYHYSPFAESLADYLPVPGLEIADLFRAVHGDVQRRTRIFTRGPQEPWLLNRLDSDYYFLAPPSTAAVGAASDGAEKPLDVDQHRLETGDEFGLATELLAKRGLPAIVARAHANDATAQYLLAYMLQYGVGVTQDADEAGKWLEKSTAAGHPAALAVSGSANMQSADDPAQEARGREMLERAAAQDFARAHYFLGDLDKAAEDGDAYSAFLLADRGEVDRGFALLKGMAESGDDFAENWLCELAVIHGRTDIGAESCEFAARAGFLGARTHLASLYGALDKGGSPSQTARHWAVLGRATIYYDMDPVRLRGHNRKIVVSQLLEALDRRPWTKLTVAGHTDQTYPREYAIRYSERIARNAVVYLMSMGVPAEKIETVAYGALQPNSKSFGFAPINRRVEIIVEWADQPAP